MERAFIFGCVIGVGLFAVGTRPRVSGSIPSGILGSVERVFFCGKRLL